MLAIQKYILEHGIDKTIADFKLKTRIYSDKILLKYDQLVSPTLMALPEMQDCRGLILEIGTWKVLSLAFRKFFNLQESNAHKIDWTTARILEKLDGTMIQVYNHKNEWFAATTGTIDGSGEVNNKLGTTFNSLFWDTVKNKYNLDLNVLNNNFCYVFELTTPYNIVVKPHSESSATLLTVRNLTTLEELSYEEVISVGAMLGLPVVKSYDLNVDVETILHTFDGCDVFFEGYVIVDANFNRVKIKSPKYIAIHHLKNRTAEYHIMEIVKTNEIEEFGATFPERKAELHKLKENYDKLLVRLNNIWLELKPYKPKNITPEEKKKFAAAVFEICAKDGLKMFSGLYFSLYDGKTTSVEDYLMKYDNKILYKIL